MSIPRIGNRPLCLPAACLLAALACAAPTPPGLEWIDSPAGPGAMTPRWAADASEGDLRLSWLEPTGGDGLALRLSRWADGAWEPPATIVTSERFFANWADFPSVVVAGDGTAFAHWLEKNGDETYAYGVELARSRDGGRGWSRLGSLHPDDPSPTEHGFVSLVPGDEGLTAFWLDGRKMASEGPMTLRTAEVGATVGPGTELDSQVCECCQTSAVGVEGDSLIFYRDRSDDEVRDVAALRASGAPAEPTRFEDGWRIPGCPVNGPAAAARGNLVVVAWFTGADPGPRVQVAFSNDGGRSFEPGVKVDDGRPLGRVALALTEDGEAVVTWLEALDDGAEIRARRLRASAAPGASFALAATSPARASGFPSIALRSGELFVAFRELGEDDEPSRLRVGRIAVDGLPGPA